MPGVPRQAQHSRSPYLEDVDWRSPSITVSGKVGGTDLQGIDLITIDAAGQLVNIDVMIRPINAVEALMEIVTPRMTEFFATRATTN